MRVTKIFSTRLDDKNQRLVKFLRMGREDVRECLMISPFGIDSAPIKDMAGIQAETSVNGDDVFLGVINQLCEAKPGETRLYSLTPQGTLSIYTWLRDNGDIWLGGDQKHIANFEDLKSGFDALRSQLNAHIQNYNTHIHATPAGASSSTVSVSQPSNASIDACMVKYIYVK